MSASADGITITCVRRNEHGRWSARVTTAEHETFVAEEHGGWHIHDPAGGRRGALAHVADRLAERVRQAERREREELFAQALASLNGYQRGAYDWLCRVGKATCGTLKRHGYGEQVMGVLVAAGLATVENIEVRGYSPLFRPIEKAADYRPPKTPAAA